jgi:hypothetical protein
MTRLRSTAGNRDSLWRISLDVISVAEPHNFYAALAPGKNLDAAPALAAPTPAPSLLYGRPTF